MITSFAINDILKKIYRYYCIIIYSGLIFFIAFDGVRDSLTFSSVLSVMREFFVIAGLGIYLLSFSFKIKLNFRFFIYLSLFFVFCYGAVFTVFPIYKELRVVSEPIVVLYKHFQFFILLLAFSVIEKNTKVSFDKFILLFVIFCLIHVAITPLAFYHPPFFFKPDFKQWGRLGIGYPTMDAQTICFSIIALIYALKVNTFLLNVCFAILVLGVLLQVTGTGMVTLAVIFLYFMVYGKNHIYKPHHFTPSIIMVVFTIVFIVLNYSNDMDKILYLAGDKVSNILNGGDGISTSIRRMQFSELKDLVWKDPFFMLFGIGAAVYVENQYSFFVIAFGLIGVGVFIVFLGYNIFIGFLERNKDRNVLLLATIIFSLTSYTLTSFYLFSNYAAFALFLTYSNHLKNRVKSYDLYFEKGYKRDKL
ncbi:hypothetical protein ACK36U_00120 [Aeromonas veronii]